MGLTRDEIIDYAARYVDRGDMKPFPHEGEIFAFLHRDIDEAKPVDEGAKWEFGGYAVCIGYHLDERVKPEGKWLFMEMISLGSFPPRHGSIRLQPPHVVLGTFRNPGRSAETRIVSLGEMATMDVEEKGGAAGDAGSAIDGTSSPDNVLRFRSRQTPDDPR